MVLTEDDYVDFLLWFASEWQNSRLLPGAIRKALKRHILAICRLQPKRLEFPSLIPGACQDDSGQPGDEERGGAAYAAASWNAR